MAALHDVHLLVRSGAGKHNLRIGAQQVVQLIVGQGFQIVAVDDSRLDFVYVHVGLHDAEPLGDVFYHKKAFEKAMRRYKLF